MTDSRRGADEASAGAATRDTRSRAKTMRAEERRTNQLPARRKSLDASISGAVWRRGALNKLALRSLCALGAQQVAGGAVFKFKIALFGNHASTFVNDYITYVKALTSVQHF